MNQNDRLDSTCYKLLTAKFLDIRKTKGRHCAFCTSMEAALEMAILTMEHHLRVILQPSQTILTPIFDFLNVKRPLQTFWDVVQVVDKG